MGKFIDKIGGRKVVLTVLVFIVSTILLIFTRMEQESYFTIVRMLVVAYTGANVTQAMLVKKSIDTKVAFGQEMLETITNGEELDKMVGRKFLLIIGMYIIVTLLYVFKVLEPLTYTDIVSWVVSVYVIGNVGSKAVSNGVSIQLGNAQSPK